MNDVEITTQIQIENLQYQINDLQKNFSNITQALIAQEIELLEFIVSNCHLATDQREIYRARIFKNRKFLEDIELVEFRNLDFNELLKS